MGISIYTHITLHITLDFSVENDAVHHIFFNIDIYYHVLLCMYIMYFYDNILIENSPFYHALLIDIIQNYDTQVVGNEAHVTGSSAAIEWTTQNKSILVFHYYRFQLPVVVQWCRNMIKITY